MKRTIRIASAQINCTVGDLRGNAGRISDAIATAGTRGVDIIAFPELAITGYPPEDLLYKKDFIADNLTAIKRIGRQVGDMIAIVGFVDRDRHGIYNAAAVFYRGRIAGVYRKMCLPNYSVFDENRYFVPGRQPAPFRCGNFVFGVAICEDIWHRTGPLARQAAGGASLVMSINASPYHTGKTKVRTALIKELAKKYHIVLSYTNLVGGQDELVFDGQSMVADARGTIVGCGAPFAEDLLITDIALPLSGNRRPATLTIGGDFTPKGLPTVTAPCARPLSAAAEIYGALVLGLRDYVTKNGFAEVVIGLSGGIDSAIVAAIAADALGKDRVTGVFMPTRYSSRQSAVDAQEVARNLGIRYMTIPIDHLFAVYLDTLKPHFAKRQRDITEENLQARIRGTVLMALSNKFGWLVLNTSNKSEASTGYGTLYGDMAGGFAVIKDIPKTLVYRLTQYRNARGRAPVIPQSVVTKEPTAELRPGQRDRDTLPPYAILDRILKAYVEEDAGPGRIRLKGSNRSMIASVITAVDRAEYKRRQSPPGVKITEKAFGKDRRMPITNKYRGR